MDYTADGHAPVIREEEAIQHPLGIYFKIWILLFVLSAMSYAVDYYQVQGYMRWFLILFFMVLKAGLIIAVFMHMVWERLAMVYFILVPPALLLTLVAIGSQPQSWASGSVKSGKTPVIQTSASSVPVVHAWAGDLANLVPFLRRI